jgi:hypothetical protein
MSSRGRGRSEEPVGTGKGNFVDWRLHPERKNLDTYDKELEDTATSPNKQGDVNMSEAEKLSKRRLGFEESPNIIPGSLALTNSAMAIDGVLHLEGPKKDMEGKVTKKKHKKANGTSVSADSGSAASLEDDRRVQ